MNKPLRSRMERVSERASATNLELFFDLVFVFALTQVTALMAESPVKWDALLRGALLLSVIWWSWIGYSWLSNLVKADEGLARMAMLTAMAAMFLLALAIPEAFQDISGGLDGPLVLAFCYLAVRVVHIWLFWIAANDDAELRAQLVRFVPSMVAGTTLLAVASQLTGAAQIAVWAAAVVADYGGTMLIGTKGWRLSSAKHFTERYGLIIMIALGESIVAIGVGVTHLAISWPIILAAMLGLAIASALWWSYFDTHVLAAEQALAEARGNERVRMGQIAFTYLHLPLLIGIVMLALGLKKVLNYVGGEDGHTLTDPLYGPALWAMYGGVALFMFAYVAVGWRTTRNFKVQRVILGVVLLAVAPLMSYLPALASLGLLTALLLALIIYEWFKYHDLREEIRHAEPS
ncbi:low temperature requirement protein A [Kibdelosporangium philippinense]|uniref:Low temperature requirement protein A n=2 Tax=Kibdelosporangium philippinense TaxID=211113 RepID=A0ABS8Z8S4_9PSEU|nr:low temperature requirement protein A [Kibdelosporangium philippinense]MCE7003489.1 low temperature requirement protein A [Kibdelosporangium philippinense]